MHSQRMKRLLVINCGSSTLKFEVFTVPSTGTGADRLLRVARGLVDRIGGHSSIELESEEGTRRWTGTVADHAEAIRMALDMLESIGQAKSGDLFGVGHRVIHGGYRFGEPVLIDDDVIGAIDALIELAPLHNRPALQAIRTSRAVLGLEIPMVAVFDTAFHQTLPEHAWRYAIDRDLADKHHIRRYGFHGLAHRYMMERYCGLAGRPPAEIKLITLQLGNGCSATAIKDGKSVDTSMGFTPLEGLIMGTRSGDIDPSLGGFVAEKEKVDIKVAEDWLNTKSGLLGVSGRTKDMRELLDAEQNGDRRAALAIDMFCYRVKKYIAAYLGVLGGAEAVVFGGGIGENAPQIRERICSGLEWCGIDLERSRNSAAVGREAEITGDNAGVRVYVITVDEASVIAHDVMRCLSGAKGAEVGNGDSRS
jgi:acetate kinase